MKKSAAVLMILAIVLSLGASAFAATGGGNDDYVYDFDYDLSLIQGKSAQGDAGLMLCLTEDDSVYEFVPMNAVINVEYVDAVKLNGKAKAAFAEAYREAKREEGKRLRKAYWFDIPNSFTLDDGHYARYLFSCDGSNVEVTVNGDPVEVVSVNGRTSYIAKITARGMIAICSDK